MDDIKKYYIYAKLTPNDARIYASKMNINY